MGGPLCASYRGLLKMGGLRFALIENVSLWVVLVDIGVLCCTP